ncbi:MAG: putative toxin-antitoxin system toxin component, PIN family [Candidatus Eisenbacteria bacterium]|nr:putative toxin-antitoxin system toxin component, PIN family [Candidatus Eisenbacteria bacterium]
MRVVLDTNVLLSALLFGGMPRQLFHECIRGEPRLLTSDALMTELTAVLNRPRFHLAGDAVRAIVGEVASVAQTVAATAAVTAIPEDPPDNAVLACAVDGKADHVVSGDGHLLDLGVYHGIPILTVREYLESVLGGSASP